jgi:hypothetical protein
VTDSIARRIVRVPVDTDGQDQRLAELGFEFRPIEGEDAIYRTAVLPRGWKARGPHTLSPLDIIDRAGRQRVVITYGSRAEPQRTGLTVRTVLVPVARMRLVSLCEYLARAVATGAPVVPDKRWCTPARIHEYASAEATRAAERGAYLSLIDQGRNADRFEDQRKAWAALASQFAPALESAA